MTACCWQRMSTYVHRSVLLTVSFEKNIYILHTLNVSTLYRWLSELEHFYSYFKFADHDPCPHSWKPDLLKSLFALFLFYFKVVKNFSYTQYMLLSHKIKINMYRILWLFHKFKRCVFKAVRRLSQNSIWKFHL